jgi:histidinol-phosphatase
MPDDLELAFRMVDAADAVTAVAWKPSGISALAKADGSPVTEADVAAETAMLRVLRAKSPDDSFVGEELGHHPGTSGRRWIADGIDGTRFFAVGASTWGTLLALEVDGEIRVGVCSSPLQQQRWWAVRGGGAFTGSADRSTTRTIRVSSSDSLGPDRMACLPRFNALGSEQQQALEQIIGGRPSDIPWSQQCRVAEGEIAACVWFGGDIWDHAAPSLIVEEAGGRFSDHSGSTRLDTRTAIYSNGHCHDELLKAVRASRPQQPH